MQILLPGVLGCWEGHTSDLASVLDYLQLTQNVASRTTELQQIDFCLLGIVGAACDFNTEQGQIIPGDWYSFVS